MIVCKTRLKQVLFIQKEGIWIKLLILFLFCFSKKSSFTLMNDDTTLSGIWFCYRINVLIRSVIAEWLDALKYKGPGFESSSSHISNSPIIASTKKSVLQSKWRIKLSRLGLVDPPNVSNKIWLFNSNDGCSAKMNWFENAICNYKGAQMSLILYIAIFIFVNNFSYFQIVLCINYTRLNKLLNWTEERWCYWTDLFLPSK